MMSKFKTDEAKWQAVEARDSTARDAFVCAVKTTGIYCQPDCPGRPLQKNVEFFDAPDQAVAAGYRECKRCWK